MKHIPWKTALGTALSVGLIAAPLAAVPAFAVEVSPAAGTSPVIINEAYLSGGSAGAAYKNKFVELYNTSDAPVSLDGWSLQYRSATSAAAPSFAAPLTGSIPAKGYYLLKGGANGTAPVGAELPAADVTATGFNPAGGAGTIVLAKQAAALSPLATGSVIESSNVADLLGYGTSNTFETQAATAPAGNSDVKSLNRSNGVDSNNNAADFTLNATITPKAANGAAAPRRSARRSGPGHSPGHQDHRRDPGQRHRQPARRHLRHHPRQGHRHIPHRRILRLLHPDPRHRRRPDPGQPHGVGRCLRLLVGHGRFRPGRRLCRGDGRRQRILRHDPGDGSRRSGPEEAHRGSPRGQGHRLCPPGRGSLPRIPRRHAADPAGSRDGEDNYSLNQYGEIGLAGGTTPLEQPTAVAEYGSADVHRHRRRECRPRHQARRRRHHQLPQGRHHQGPGTAVPDHGGSCPRRRHR